jgi:hypothetical protein
MHSFLSFFLPFIDATQYSLILDRSQGCGGNVLYVANVPYPPPFLFFHININYNKLSYFYSKIGSEPENCINDYDNS